MADSKISALDAVSASADTDIVPVVQGGATKRATLAQMVTQLLATARTFVGTVTLSGGVKEKYETLTQSGATLTIPAFVGQTCYFTPSEAVTTMTMPDPLVEGTFLLLEVTQGATGYAVAVPSGMYHPNGMYVPISTVANSVSQVRFRVGKSGTLHYDCQVRATV
jgi:hypothetical protein